MGQYSSLFPNVVILLEGHDAPFFCGRGDITHDLPHRAPVQSIFIIQSARHFQRAFGIEGAHRARYLAQTKAGVGIFFHVLAAFFPFGFEQQATFRRVNRRAIKRIRRERKAAYLLPANAIKVAIMLFWFPRKILRPMPVATGKSAPRCAP